jgi:hypothetical protein
MKPKRFFFHFNRPASQKAGTPKMSVHWDNSCQIVDKVVCAAPTQSKINKHQPRVVMQGTTTTVNIVNVEGVVTAFIGQELTTMYDDSRPLHAALQMLTEDGYATDQQRRVAQAALERIVNLERTVETYQN